MLPEITIFLGTLFLTIASILFIVTNRRSEKLIDAYAEIERCKNINDNLSELNKGLKLENEKLRILYRNTREIEDEEGRDITPSQD